MHWYALKFKYYHISDSEAWFHAWIRQWNATSFMIILGFTSRGLKSKYITLWKRLNISGVKVPKRVWKLKYKYNYCTESIWIICIDFNALLTIHILYNFEQLEFVEKIKCVISKVLCKALCELLSVGSWSQFPHIWKYMWKQTSHVWLSEWRGSCGDVLVLVWYHLCWYFLVVSDMWRACSIFGVLVLVPWLRYEVVLVNCLWWVSLPLARSTYGVAFASRHTLEKSYHNGVAYFELYWWKVITNRRFIKNPTNFIHLTLARGFSAKATNRFSAELVRSWHSSTVGMKKLMHTNM